MKKKEKQKFKYPLKSFRLSPEIYEELLKEKKETETWNLFFRRLLDKEKQNDKIKRVSKGSD